MHTRILFICAVSSARAVHRTGSGPFRQGACMTTRAHRTPSESPLPSQTRSHGAPRRAAAHREAGASSGTHTNTPDTITDRRAGAFHSFLRTSPACFRPRTFQARCQNVATTARALLEAHAAALHVAHLHSLAPAALRIHALLHAAFLLGESGQVPGGWGLCLEGAAHPWAQVAFPRRAVESNVLSSSNTVLFSSCPAMCVESSGARQALPASPGPPVEPLQQHVSRLSGKIGPLCHLDDSECTMRASTTTCPAGDQVQCPAQRC